MASNRATDGLSFSSRASTFAASSLHVSRSHRYEIDIVSGLHRGIAETRMMDREFLNAITSLIIDKAILVHSKLGPGLLESVYRTCLTFELRNAGQKVAIEQLVPVCYDGIQMEEGYRLDMLVNDAVIVEIKSVAKLLPVHQAQLLSYLRLLDKRVGLLINFNVPYLVQGIKRLVHNF
jgi:GxxExxY protein